MPKPDDAADLEFNPEQMRALGEAALRRCVDHIATLGQQPASADLSHAEEICRSLREGTAPEHGTDFEPLLDLLFETCVPLSINAPGPGYLAYIPGGGLFPAALADLIADMTNRFTGTWRAAPALVQLEANVLDWFRDWMGFPPSTAGLFTNGGSTATFNAIACAREQNLGPDLRLGVLYTSTQAHHSVAKSARLAGILHDRVRSIPVDDRFQMRVDALAGAIAEDRSRGLIPFLVSSTAGTTNTGAVDPLDSIADLCASEGLWHHVDGAYGAFFRLVEPLQSVLGPIARADSLTLDPHKSLFLPYGTGTLLVRDGEALRALHSASGSYMPATPDLNEFYDPCQYGPDLSRHYPGLRVWLTLKLLGLDRLRAALLEKRTLAVDAAARIARLPGIDLVAPPVLSLFAFQLTWPGSSLSQRNAATLLLLDRIRERNRVLMTGCTLDDGRFLARVCILSFRTRREHVELCIRHVAEESAAILEECGGERVRE